MGRTSTPGVAWTIARRVGAARRPKDKGEKASISCPDAWHGPASPAQCAEDFYVSTAESRKPITVCSHFSGEVARPPM